MKTTNQFIESQQEVARKELGEPAEGYSHYNVDGCTVDRIVEQAIKNTGEELMRRVEGESRFEEPGNGQLYGDGYEDALDTLKKHIASVTWVE